jgi:MFS family permease
MLKRLYPDAYAGSTAQANVSSITFAGTVLGMLFFGFTSDHWSRKWSLFVWVFPVSTLYPREMVVSVWGSADAD